MKGYAGNTREQAAHREPDLVRALVWGTVELREDLEKDTGLATFQSTEEIMCENERELDNYLEQNKECLDWRKVDELAMLAQGSRELWGYEQGMRYGARLVFQLLTGREVSELDGVLGTAVSRAVSAHIAADRSAAM